MHQGLLFWSESDVYIILVNDTLQAYGRVFSLVDV